MFRFSWNSFLTTHRLSHSRKRLHKCDTCEKSFDCKSSLKMHKIQHVGFGKSHKCDVCEKSFDSKSSLKVHKIQHVGLGKPHKCDICEKSFGYLSSLKMHMACHSSEDAS